MKQPLSYACLSIPTTLGQQWEYVVRDPERDVKYAVGFTVSTVEVTLGRFDVREHWARRCEEELWSAIRRASPGTYLEARALGWVPENVTKLDVEPERSSER